MICGCNTHDVSPKSCTSANKMNIVKVIHDMSDILKSLVEEEHEHAPAIFVPPKAIFTYRNGAIFSPFVETRATIAHPVFKTWDNEPAQNPDVNIYRIKQGTAIELVDLVSNNVVIDGQATLLQDMEIQIPNGVTLSQGGNSFTTGHSSTSARISFFVLPNKTNLKIGATKQVTSVEYFFRCYPKSILIQNPKSLLKIGDMKVTSTSVEEMSIMPNYED